MSHVHEYRVRPVNRFVLTEYIRHDGPGQNSQGSPRTVAELPNAELANELGQALQRANPGSTLVDSEGAHTPASGREFVIVEAHVFAPGVLVYYAYSEQEAELMRTKAQMVHKRDFKIFERPGAYDPNAPIHFAADRIEVMWGAMASATCVQVEDRHTNYPARHAIGARVIRSEVGIPQTGVGQLGILHHYDAEEAEVVGVHFYPGKVCYDVVFPSGRHGETVDSVELTDLPLDPLSTTVP